MEFSGVVVTTRACGGDTWVKIRLIQIRRRIRIQISRNPNLKSRNQYWISQVSYQSISWTLMPVNQQELASFNILFFVI